MTTLLRLLAARDDDAALGKAYADVLSELVADPPWDGLSPDPKRIPWRLGRDARKSFAELFEQPGLYIWGAEERPLYLGKTCSSFQQRFSRYVWQERSQCLLAADYGDEIAERGIDGFPEEIRDWYRSQQGGGTVRLRGAVRFAEEGIDGIWFALLPHPSCEEIELLERSLIPVANAWNEESGLRPLLNVEFTRGQD